MKRKKNQIQKIAKKVYNSEKTVLETRLYVCMCNCNYISSRFLDRLVQKRNIRMQRRRVTSRNPLRVLAARTDLRSEYTEFRTNIAARTIKSANVEKRE